jgi:hypothetical protein
LLVDFPPVESPGVEENFGIECKDKAEVSEIEARNTSMANLEEV